MEKKTGKIALAILFVAWVAALVVGVITAPTRGMIHVEYDRSLSWKKFQMMPIYADISKLSVKKARIGPSTTWRLLHGESAGMITVYALPDSMPVRSFTIDRSQTYPRIMSVVTPKGTTVPFFDHGLMLNDGVYSLSTKHYWFTKHIFLKIQGNNIYISH